MSHLAQLSRTVLLGGFVLFCSLLFLLAMEGELTGRATTGTQVNISNSTPVNCTTVAYQGLNTISFPCMSTSMDRAEVIDGTGVVAMYQYVPGESDVWKTYNPNLPSWVVNDLQFLSRRAGYVLIMSQAQSYQISGLQVLSTDVPLVSGWNLVGYPSLSVKNTSTGFSSIAATLRQARTYNNSANTYLIYTNPGGTMTTVVPGQGYWINSSAATTWVVTGS